jgi:hypothetical protein
MQLPNWPRGREVGRFKGEGMVYELSPARSGQPVSCTPSDTGSKEKSVVEDVTPYICIEEG